METVIGSYKDIEFAAQLLQAGEVVAFPTETVYGLGGNAYSEAAIKKIFTAKGRPQDNPLIVHIANIRDLEQVAIDIPKIAYLLLDKFAPGPLTLVLKKHSNIPYQVTAGGESVAVRIPAHEMALELIRQANIPICAPSANTSSRVSPTLASHVYEDLQGKIPLILDGGSCDIGVESTVLDLTRAQPAILRPGAVTASMLAPFLNVSMAAPPDETAKSPGTKYRHYASLAKVELASTPKEALEKLKAWDKDKAIILGSKDFIDSCKKGISLGATSAEIARNLFAALRKVEKQFNYIIIERFPETEENIALLNRITKAIN